MTLSASFRKTSVFFLNYRIARYFRHLVIYLLMASMLSSSLMVVGATIPAREARSKNPTASDQGTAKQPSPEAAARPQPFSPQGSTGTRDSKGTDFWLTFPANSSGGANDQLLISSEQNTTGTVTETGLGSRGG